MGKKKSVALMLLLTVVIAVLCAITIFPSFAIPWTAADIWNPAVMQFDFGNELGGGYYAYYYPEGVIDEATYESALEMLTDEDEKKEYEESYKKYGDGLYLNVDEEYGIYLADGETLSEDYKKEFDRFVKTVADRYAEMDYSDYRVAVVDDYAVRVELPASETSYSSVFSMFSYTGELTLKMSDAVLDELDKKDVDIKDYIEGFDVTTQYDVAYLEVELTEKGEKLFKDKKSSLTSSSEAQGNSSSVTGITLCVGDNQVGFPILKDYIDGDTVMIPEAEAVNVAAVESYAIILNSALENGGFEFSVSQIEASEIRMFEPVYGGDLVVTLLYIAIFVAIVALIVLPIIRQGRYGIVNAYVILSYLIITGLCFAFISKGVYEINFASVLVFLTGLALVSFLNNRYYQAVKKEFYLGKTVESAVKTGYKKCLFPAVDVYAVLTLGAIVLAIAGAAGVHLMGLQALICFLAGAFCNLLWTFAVNFVFLSASKNKYKYFRFVREDDDDE